MDERRWTLAGIVLLAVLSVAVGVRAEEEPVTKEGAAIEALAWLTGTWVEVDDTSVFTEVWGPPQGDAMIGHDHWTVGGVTRMVELIAVERAATGLVMRLRHFGRGLVPSPAEKDGPMEFPLKSLEGTKVVFEHPTRAWPRSMTYERKGDELIGSLAGVENGKPSEIPFHFKLR
jgi:hypothetical protein